MTCKKIVLITGCDSGFGMFSSINLSSAGYRVVSACLTEEGRKRLDGTSALTVLCDVTREENVLYLAAAVLKLATEQDLQLWAVINNAGIAPMGYMDWLSMESIRKVMDVNYFGAILVIKAMLPQLKRVKGSRIINISSVAGYSTGPGLGAYSGSKHALEGMSKSLRMELKPWGIHVANINPGFMNTPMCNQAEGIILKLYNEAPSSVRNQYPGAEENMRGLAGQVNFISENPSVVVNQIKRLVGASNPSAVNWTGWLAWAIRFSLMLPYWVQELFSMKALPRHIPSSY